MRINHFKKGVVAVAAAFSLLLLLASPASADTIGHMEITGGTLSAAGQTFDLDPSAGPQGPCILPAATVTVDFDPNTPASSGTWTISGSWKSQFKLGTPPAGPWYQADFNIVSGTGVWSHNPGGPPFTSSLSTTAPNHVVFQVRIYQVDNGGTCAKNLLKCIITVRVSFTGTWSSNTTTLTDVTVGDTALLNGASLPPHMVTSSCSAPFTAFNGQAATVTGLHLTTMSTAP